MGFLTPNELGDSFLAPNDRAYFHQNNLIQNCDRMSDDRQRDRHQRSYNLLHAML